MYLIRQLKSWLILIFYVQVKINSKKIVVFEVEFKIVNFFLKEKSETLIKSAFKGSFKHNMDITKQLSDSIRLLQLEKFVH